VARTLALRAKDPFWQARYYDFNVWSEKKFVEKLRYIHRNPVARGLVNKPEDWPWSSFRHYLTGAEGTVEIESQWTAEGEDGNLPEGAGALEMKTPPKQSLDGAPEKVRVGQPPFTFTRRETVCLSICRASARRQRSGSVTSRCTCSGMTTGQPADSVLVPKA